MRRAALPPNDARPVVSRTGPPTVVALFQLEDAIANLECRRRGSNRWVRRGRVTAFCERPSFGRIRRRVTSWRGCSVLRSIRMRASRRGPTWSMSVGLAMHSTHHPGRFIDHCYRLRSEAVAASAFAGVAAVWGAATAASSVISTVSRFAGPSSAAGDCVPTVRIRSTIRDQLAAS